jgi:hypothetical protein
MVFLLSDTILEYVLRFLNNVSGKCRKKIKGLESYDSDLFLPVHELFPPFTIEDVNFAQKERALVQSSIFLEKSHFIKEHLVATPTYLN